MWSSLLTRSSAREHLGLCRWEAEGGALALDAKPVPPKRRKQHAWSRRSMPGS